MFAPASAKPKAICLPKPVPPPVTMAVFPFRSKSCMAFMNFSSDAAPPTLPSPSRGEGKGGGSVIIESFFRLPSQVPCPYHLAKEGRRMVSIPEILFHGLETVKHDIDPRQVDQLKRSHREITADLHGLVDLFGLVAIHHAFDGLV